VLNSARFLPEKGAIYVSLEVFWFPRWSDVQDGIASYFPQSSPVASDRAKLMLHHAKHRSRHLIGSHAPHGKPLFPIRLRRMSALATSSFAQGMLPRGAVGTKIPWLLYAISIRLRKDNKKARFGV
jgi:hypothetical protein